MSEQIVTKTCRTCKQTKPISQFYNNPRNKEGYRNDCKTCHLKYVKEYKQTEKGKDTQKRYYNTEKGKVAVQVAGKRYRKSEKGRLSKRNSVKRYSIRHPERYKAKIAVNNSIQIGKLPRVDTLFCHYCPNRAKEYHHWHGYAPEHWFDVIPVCKKCHSDSQI